LLAVDRDICAYLFSAIRLTEKATSDGTLPKYGFPTFSPSKIFNTEELAVAIALADGRLDDVALQTRALIEDERYNHPFRRALLTCVRRSHSETVAA